MPRYKTEEERQKAHKEARRRANTKYYEKTADKQRAYGREYGKKRRANMTEDDRLRERINRLHSVCREPLELIINYDKAAADNFEGWNLHHLLETHRYVNRARTRWAKRDEQVPKKVLVALGLYYNRPAKEFVFLRADEHTRIHAIGNSHKKGKTGPRKYKTPEEIAKVKKDRAAKSSAYYCQRCIYNGKEMSLGSLAAILSKNGDPHPCKSAKSYIINNHER